MPVSSASPHSGHRSRLRQRLAREPLAVADYEILELLLGYGQPRKDTKPLARELLLRFHNIRGVLDAPPEQLLAVPGFGPGLLSMWQVLREVLARHAAAPLLQGVEVATPQAVAEMARARLAGSQQEECWLAMVNAGNPSWPGNACARAMWKASLCCPAMYWSLPCATRPAASSWCTTIRAARPGPPSPTSSSPIPCGSWPSTWGCVFWTM